MTEQELAEFRAFQEWKANGAPKAQAGPDKLIGDWTKLKREYDSLGAKLGTLAAQAEEIRVQLQEYNITVPPFGAQMAVRPVERPYVQGGEQPVRQTPSNSAIAEVVAEETGVQGSYTPPAQRSVEIDQVGTGAINPNNPSLIDQLRRDSGVQGADASFAGNVAGVMGNLKKMFPN